MAHFKVRLSPKEFAALKSAAVEERRPVRLQAAVLLGKALRDPKCTQNGGGK
jgi:hypothetical protein